MSEKFLTAEYEQGLSSEIREVLSQCSKVALNENISIYLIGGVVRDLFLRKEISDIDIIVEGNAIEYARKLEKKLGCKILRVQKELKTAKVLFENGVEIDFASTRCETYPKPGFLPSLSWHSCSLKDDVIRRDFTINAMALSLNEKDKFKLVDYLDGYSDLISAKLKILHDNSFSEDPSRIVRGLKFSVRFGFCLESKTKELQEKYLNSDLNAQMPLERVKSEIKQLFSLNSPLAYDKFLSQKLYRLFREDIEYVISGQTIFEVIDMYKVKVEELWLIYFATLLVGQKNDLLDRLNLSGKEQKVILDTGELLFQPKMHLATNYEIYKFFHKKSDLSVIVYYVLTQDQRAKLYLDELKNVKLLISGEDLINAGIPPSSKYRAVFESMLIKKINDGLTSKEEELNYLKLLLKSFD